MDQNDQIKSTPEALMTLQEKRKPTYRKIMRWLWGFTITGIIGTAALFVTLSFQHLPTFDELENPKSNLASEIIADNGEVFGRYYIENRVQVSFDEISPFVEQALISTEDERYYQHSGIDVRGLFRVAIKTVILRQKSAGGASTISQQLAKMLFTESPGSGFERVIQKLKEWIIAVKLERSYTKQEIMAMYLNKFSFLNGAYGIKAASEVYFDASQDSLSIEQAATLVGMLKNPALFNPLRRPEMVSHRRMVVFSQMEKNGFINNIEYDSLRKLPLDMSQFSRQTHADGLAPYFRMELRKELYKILAQKEYLKSDGTQYNIFKDGLRIYTTINPVIQKHAEESVREHMSKLQQTFDKHWKGKDPWTYRDPSKEREELEAEDASRKRSMKNIIRDTERYKNMRTIYLADILKKIGNEIDDYELKDHEIERIIAGEEGGSFTKLVSRNMITSALAVMYKKVLNSPNFPQLKGKWALLQSKVRKDFETPTEMRVFAYNAQMEKDTVMSPLDSIKYHRNFLQVGSMAVDPLTGHVKAWVGGINHKYFQFDHVTTERQVGSTFKPFIYATAIDQVGISPCFVVDDLPYTIHKGEGNFNLLKDWTPQNADGKYSGNSFTLFKGLQWSKNTVSVYLMKQLGDTRAVRNLVKGLGVDVDRQRANGTFKIPKQPSICLGSSDLTVMEMSGAYTAFANNGIYNKPIFITRIEDRNGNVIYSEVIEDRIALNPNSNYVMIQMLKNVVNQGLPGFNGLKSEMAGKTGTTNDYVDGWFMGMTPDLVVGTWVGGDDRWVRFRSLSLGIGAKMARPIYAKLLQRLEHDPESGYNASKRFYRPPGDIGIEMDCESYKHDRGPYGGFEEGGEENEDFGDEWGDEVKQDTTENEEF
ncbi:MAG: penicillin-binding protein 1A [Saprospiraceae bacterium]|jgi:penicillin-binding protein 1A